MVPSGLQVALTLLEVMVCHALLVNKYTWSISPDFLQPLCLMGLCVIACETFCSLQVHRLDIPELRQAMRSGNMLLPSVTTAYLAIEDLQQRGYLV